ncbi:DNA primase family protein, partial [Avibacterium paragallinarum]
MMNGKTKYKATKPQPMEDQIILIGEEAWEAWGNGQGTLWQMLNENQLKEPCDFKPYIFGPNPLKNIPEITLAPKNQQYIKLFECGKLTEEQKTAICHNLAT